MKKLLLSALTCSAVVSAQTVEVIITDTPSTVVIDTQAVAAPATLSEENVVREVGSQLAETPGELGQAAKDGFEKIKEGAVIAKDGIVDVAHAAVEKTKTAYAATKEVAQEAADKTKEAAVKTYNVVVDLSKAAGQKAVDAKDTVAQSAFVQEAKEVSQELGGQFYEAGQDIYVVTIEKPVEVAHDVAAAMKRAVKRAYNSKIVGDVRVLAADTAEVIVARPARKVAQVATDIAHSDAVEKTKEVAYDIVHSEAVEDAQDVLGQIFIDAPVQAAENVKEFATDVARSTKELAQDVGHGTKKVGRAGVAAVKAAYNAVKDELNKD